jgi:hypothetical protein
MKHVQLPAGRAKSCQWIWPMTIRGYHIAAPQRFGSRAQVPRPSLTRARNLRWHVLGRPSDSLRLIYSVCKSSTSFHHLVEASHPGTNI